MAIAPLIPIALFSLVLCRATEDTIAMHTGSGSHLLFDDPILETKHNVAQTGNIVIILIGTLVVLLLITLASIILYKYCVYRRYEGLFKLSTDRLQSHDLHHYDEEELTSISSSNGAMDECNDSQYGTF
eukprot:973733_1